MKNKSKEKVKKHWRQNQGGTRAIPLENLYFALLCIDCNNMRNRKEKGEGREGGRREEEVRINYRRGVS